MSGTQEFDFSVKLLNALLWRYNDAENLQSLLQKKADWYAINQEAFWRDFIRDVFDLRTCNDFGCAVWAIILGVPLAVVLPASTKKAWGFGQYRANFNRGNFAPREQYSIPLSLPQKRLVLQLRYFQLISRGTVPQTNHFLQMAFKDYGLVYVLDPLNMGEIVYVFTFAIPRQLKFVLLNYDLLPRPDGCGVRYEETVRRTWGFGPHHQNFERGTFEGA